MAVGESVLKNAYEDLKMVDHTVKEIITWLGDIYQDNAMQCIAMPGQVRQAKTMEDNARQDQMMTLRCVASSHRLNRTSINIVSISEI